MRWSMICSVAVLPATYSEDGVVNIDDKDTYKTIKKIETQYAQQIPHNSSLFSTIAVKAILEQELFFALYHHAQQAILHEQAGHRS